MLNCVLTETQQLTSFFLSLIATAHICTFLLSTFSSFLENGLPFLKKMSEAMCYLLPQYLSSTRKLPCTFTHLYPLSPLTCQCQYLPMSIPQPIHLISSPDSSKIYQSVINPLLSRTFLLSLLLQNLHYFCLRMFIFPFYKKKRGGGGFPFTLVLPQLTFHFSTLIHLLKSRKSSLQQLSSFFIMYFFQNSLTSWILPPTSMY